MSVDSSHDRQPVLIALAGNPNVGKSTVFNALTGLSQHTGNWTGKTVSNAVGQCHHKGKTYVLADIPGTYSLDALSCEERVACEFLTSGDADVAVVVVDSTMLERNLLLAMQVINKAPRAVICANLMDEAKKQGLSLDLPRLEELMGVPCVACSARSKQGLDQLMDVVSAVAQSPISQERRLFPADTAECCALAESIAGEVVLCGADKGAALRGRIDRLLTSRAVGLPLMLLLLGAVFFITIQGANLPSAFLSRFLLSLELPFANLLAAMGLPSFVVGALAHGMYRVTAWVVSVMLPPMAIFFPLFTLFEDWGLLPRIAFNLDRGFSRCHACGKQALTTCMGFGCNAVGVTACRIIDSKRERMIAMLTNSLVPCNGRFPLLIALITAFIAGSGLFSGVVGALLLCVAVALSVAMSLFASWLLSKTLLSGVSGAYVLEIPPLRRPQILKTLIRSLIDRTAKVLVRAVSVAAPCGLVIWLLANVSVGDSSLLERFILLLEPVGRFLGMDGTILSAFILGLPANEIVLPLTLMGYTSGGVITEFASTTEMAVILRANGWTLLTVVNVILFSMFHWPCATTLLTIRRESGSLLWTLVGFTLPTLLGAACCVLLRLAVGLFGGAM